MSHLAVDAETILKEYLSAKNVKVVARKLGLPIGVVRRVLLSVCGPLYGSPGLCRLYIYMRDRCFASAKEVSKDLGVSLHDVYYLFHTISASNVGLALVELVHQVKRLFLVKTTVECWSEYNKYAMSLVGER